MTISTKPTAVALVICDNIYSEPTGKTALIGLFTKISGQKFPLIQPRMAIYVSISDIRKGTILKLDIVHTESQEPVFVTGGPPPDQIDPTVVLEITFQLTNIVFKEPGRYDVRFWGNEHVLMQRPFDVEKIEG